MTAVCDGPQVDRPHASTVEQMLAADESSAEPTTSPMDALDADPCPLSQL